ncbi:MAG: PEP-CTERM sorting domain-containing protein [Candidatus Aminicenantes bacterium]|nr:PEP-CTERM sorting domain-containing protein [Candidatus Aminicenantes bacterium]
MKRWVVLLMGAGLVFSAGAVIAPPEGQVPSGSFQALGCTYPDYFYSSAFDVSLDGTTVVGNTLGNGFVWKESTGSVALPGGVSNESAAEGVSSDGMIVAGSVYTQPGGPGQETCRWTLVEGQWIPEPLGDLAGGEYRSYGRSMSPDGNVIVGRAGSVLGAEACRWMLTEGTWVLKGLGDLPNGAYSSEAYGCSADGSVVIGQGSITGGPRAFRWTSATGMKDLGVAGRLKWSIARGCSGDGSVVVGTTFSTVSKDGLAFRWTPATGMVSLGVLSGAKTSEAWATSPDGSIVVGTSSAKGGYRAFIWDAASGMRRVEDVLVAHNVFPPSGWVLVCANGVTVTPAGETVIVGLGFNPSGQTEAWRAVIGQ